MRIIPIIAMSLAANLAPAETLTDADCRQAFVSSVAFSLTTESTLDRCLEHDVQSCALFVGIIQEADIIPKLTRAAACIDAEMIDTDLLFRYNEVIGRMRTKTKRLAAVFGGER